MLVYFKIDGLIMIFAPIKTLALVFILCFSSYSFAGSITKQEAAASAQRSYSGRILSVKLKQSVYNVKILNANGQVRIVKVNAKNGQIQ